MKTKEELNALKEEFETLNRKLAELTEDELRLVTGGFDPLVDQLLTTAPRLAADGLETARPDRHNIREPLT